MASYETPSSSPTNLARMFTGAGPGVHLTALDAVLAQLHPLTLFFHGGSESLEQRAAREVTVNHFGIVKAPAETPPLREDDPVSDKTDAKAGGWSFTWLGTQRIPVHCGHMADDLDLGEWECRGCDAVTHVRDIPGWRATTRG